MSRCIVVTGTGRSGTSLTAMVLHHLGVHMGDDLVPGDKTNPHGHYEDARLIAEHRVLSGYGLERSMFNADAYCRYLRQRAEERELWGFKDPRLLDGVWPFVRSNMPCQYSMVVCLRELEDVKTSYEVAYGRREDAFMEQRFAEAMRLVKKEHDVVAIRFRSMLDQPVETILSLAWMLQIPCGIDLARELAKLVDPSVSKVGRKAPERNCNADCA